MKNNNIIQSSFYSALGAFLGSLLSISLSSILEYLSSALHKETLGEFSMIFFIISFPFFIIAGLILGIIYARKYKK